MAISGIIGVVARDIYSFFAKAIGLAKFNIWQVGAQLFVKSKAEVQTPMGTLLGFLNDIFIGANVKLFVRKTSEADEEREDKVKERKQVKKDKVRDKEDDQHVVNVPEHIILVEVDKEKPTMLRKIRRFVKPRKI